MYSQAVELDEMITDQEQTGAIVVSLPEEMPVNETATLEKELRDSVGVSVDRVIMNAVYPERFGSSDLPAIEGLTDSDEPELHAAGRAALSELRRTEAQQEQIERLESLISTPMTTLPFVFEPEITLAAARMLGEAID
jgi:anion-transporting  ArsA/GET3 family ATPase